VPTAAWALLGLSWLLLALLVLITAAWCSWTATRLDRLHLRCEAAATAVRAHLLQRSAVAVELAGGGLTDPASALVLLDAAHTAREAEAATQIGSDLPATSASVSPVPAWLAESDPPAASPSPAPAGLAESGLTSALHAVELPSADTEPLVAELRDAARRASMARRIHNDLAARTAELHSRRRVRWFRLAGHARVPVMIDFDDRVP
jgi:hypothetical protein